MSKAREKKKRYLFSSNTEPLWMTVEKTCGENVGNRPKKKKNQDSKKKR